MNVALFIFNLQHSFYMHFLLHSYCNYKRIVSADLVDITTLILPNEETTDKC